MMIRRTQFKPDWKWSIPFILAALTYLGNCAMGDHDRLGKVETSVYWLQWHSKSGPTDTP